MAKQWTLSYDERVQGWTSFHSFMPEWMIGMNNRFFTFKGGNLFLHHTQDNARNTYYGQHYPTQVSVMVNDFSSEVKFIKAISTEGNTTWRAVVTGYISSLEEFSRTTLERSNFVKKEGLYYTYLRRNEVASDRSAKSNYGIGVVQAFVSTNRLQLSTELPFSLAVGDTILNSSAQTVGTVSSLIAPSTIVLEAPPANISPGDFIIGNKNARIQGGEIRGYTVRVDLENDDTTKAELFAVNLDAAKSYS